MPSYLVSYDLSTPGQDYDMITSAIGTMGDCAHVQRSVWILKTSHSITSVFEYLEKLIDNNDKLFVSQLAGPSLWTSQGDLGDLLIKSAIET